MVIQDCNDNILLSKAITWIDWNTEGNLLASCSQDKSVRLYDLRVGYAVKTIPDLHLRKN